MNALMWIVQSILAFLCLAGGAYKIIAFEELAKMPATAELSRLGWTTLGVVEIVCGVLLIIPSALKWRPILTPIAAAVLSLESFGLALMYARHSVQITAINPLPWVVAVGVLAAIVAYARAPSRVRS